MKIWLADLTYTQQSIASDIVPAAVAMIAEYVESNLSGSAFEIFKYPEDLSAAFETADAPDVIGFSNYVWNYRLSSAFAATIKAVRPATITVMGGPNMPIDPVEQEAWMRSHPWIDYYVLKEGEAPFLDLLRHLQACGNAKPIIPLDNILFLDAEGNFRKPRAVQRMQNLEGIPSPYTSGRLDAFLDGRLMPVLQTNRGCPFSCTFCTEGQGFWSKVRRKSPELLADEITYIARKITSLPPERRRHDLLIADSNFGMFAEDLDVCRQLAKTQEEHAYPQYINVATGKNKKERVLEAAKIVNGAMSLAGSVQSLDEEVLRKIKRSNISADQILDLALKAKELNANSYSEIILALPGDTKAAHLRGLGLLINAGFRMVSMYQLMMLPGTEMAEKRSREENRMDVRYRVLPRCFGTYRLLGHELSVAEIEEVCVANATLSYDDYLECRLAHLMVNIFYNDGVFAPVINRLRVLNVMPWQWIEDLLQGDGPEDLRGLIEDFLKETREELWLDHQALIGHTASADTIARYIDGELGSNLIYKYKALSMTLYFDRLCAAAKRSVSRVLHNHGADALEIELFDQMIEFRRLQVRDICAPANIEMTGEFSYDIETTLVEEKQPPASALQLTSPRTYRFLHNPQQREIIASYLNAFGADTRGLTRFVSRFHLEKLFRKPTAISVHAIH